MSRIFILGFVCHQTILHVEIEESLCVYTFLTNKQQYILKSGLEFLPTKAQGTDVPSYKSSIRAISFTCFPFVDNCRIAREPVLRGSQEHYSAQSGSLIYKATKKASETCTGEYYYDYGNQIRIRYVDPSKNVITGLPFEALYRQELVDGTGSYIATSMTAMDIAHFQMDHFAQPTYLQAGEFSILTFKDVKYPERDIGFVATSNGLIFKDKHGLCFPLTEQLILLLVAISPYFPRDMKYNAFRDCYGDIQSTPIRCGDKLPRQIARMLFKRYFKMRKRVTKLHGQERPYSNVPQSDSLDYEPQSGGVYDDRKSHAVTQPGVYKETEEVSAVQAAVIVAAAVVGGCSYLVSLCRKKYKPQSGMAVPLIGTEAEAAAFTGNSSEQDGGLKSKSSTRFGPAATNKDVVKPSNQIGTAMDDKGREMQLLHTSGAVVTSYPVVAKSMGFASGL